MNKKNDDFWEPLGLTEEEVKREYEEKRQKTEERMREVSEKFDAFLETLSSEQRAWLIVDWIPRVAEGILEQANRKDREKRVTEEDIRRAIYDNMDPWEYDAEAETNE